MLGRDTRITLQNEAKSHTTEVKSLPGDAIALLAFSTGSSVFLVLGGNLRSPRRMGAWAVYTTGCLSSPSSRRRFLATWGAAEETSWCFYSVCDSECDLLTGTDQRSHSIQLMLRLGFRFARNHPELLLPSSLLQDLRRGLPSLERPLVTDA